ncbi:MAG: type VI secretion system tip protein TssI/VgrG, partial [Pseudomonadota bacterium]
DDAYLIAQLDETALYKIVARPALTLYRTPKFTVHQKDKMTLKDVITTVMGKDAKASAEGYVIKNSPTFKTRSMMFQYDESDFDLLKRYLSYEGFFYYWDRANANKWTIDHKAPASSQGDVQYMLTGGFQKQGIVHFEKRSSVRANKHTVMDYNYATTQAGQFGITNSKVIAGNTLDEAMYFPGHVATAADATTNATAWGNADSFECNMVTGVSDVPKFCPLYCFKIKDYPSATATTKDTNMYYITRVRHNYVQVRFGAAIFLESLPEKYGNPVYWNTFTALPTTQTFCPKPIPKPAPMILSGRVFSATKGQEVDLDKNGLVLVQFPWDSVNNTCRIRFMQPWAGAGFGVVFVPRVGMEVMVGFENTDLDRPIIMGCVHNIVDPINAQVTKDPTTSLIRTQSSKYDKNKPGFNEIRLVDSAGKELLYTHAQKDQIGVVETDQMTHVLAGGYELNVWAKGKTVSNAPTALAVAGPNLRFYIEKGNEITEIKKGNQEHTIEDGDIVILNKKGKITITDSDGDIMVEAKSGNITIKSSKTLTLQGQNVAIKADQKVTINGNEIDITGQSKITDKAPTININADAQLNAKGAQIAIKASAMLQAQSSGPAQIKGAIVTIN